MSQLVFAARETLTPLFVVEMEAKDTTKIATQLALDSIERRRSPGDYVLLRPDPDLLELVTAEAKSITFCRSKNNPDLPFMDHGAYPAPKRNAVLGMVLAGSCNKDIAAAMGISERTVKSHVTILLKMYNCRNRLELFRHAQNINRGNRNANDAVVGGTACER